MLPLARLASPQTSGPSVLQEWVIDQGCSEQCTLQGTEAGLFDLYAVSS